MYFPKKFAKKRNFYKFVCVWQKSKTLQSRIAPTPSGFLHLGNVFNFILTWLISRKYKGKLQLRIDDIDAVRRRNEYVEDIFYVLDWLGLNYDIGPAGPDDFYQNYSQQLRLDEYHHALKGLWGKELLFACQCSRTQIKRNSIDGQYPGTCRTLDIPNNTLQTSWRIKTSPQEIVQWHDAYMGQQTFSLFNEMRDFVLKRKDNLPAYQLVSVIEDIKHNINFIVRGEDLKASTAAQLFLSKNLPNSTFHQTQFLHHPLLKNHDLKKLSKSVGALAMRQWMGHWSSPVKCYKWIAKVLGIDKSEVNSLNDLLLLFNLDTLKIQPFLP